MRRLDPVNWAKFPPSEPAGIACDQGRHRTYRTTTARTIAWGIENLPILAYFRGAHGLAWSASEKAAQMTLATTNLVRRCGLLVVDEQSPLGGQHWQESSDLGEALAQQFAVNKSAIIKVYLS